MTREIKNLSPKALQFLDWYMADPDEREIETQREWALINDVPENSISRWKRSPAWERAIRAGDGSDVEDDEDLFSEGKIEQVIAELHKAAMTGDVPAMTAYMKHAAALEAPDDADVRGMTDLELAAALDAAAAEVRARAA